MGSFAELFAAARGRLTEAPQELLGQWRTPRRVLGIGAEPKIVAVGTAWHIGAILLTDDAVAVVGEVVRVSDPGRRGYAAESARARAATRAAALRGRVPEGSTIHLGWRPVDVEQLDAGVVTDPFLLVDSVPMIRWSAAGQPMPLADYLAERTELLLRPPAGA